MNILDKKDKSTYTPSVGGTIDIAKRYSWSTDTKAMGQYRLVPKNELNIDGRYQREAKIEKVRAIASNWNWLLFGAIDVITREDGSLWVYDGGHRVRASFYRQDVSVLPCMVHKECDFQNEAKAFIGSNTLKSSVTSIQMHRAGLCAKDENSVAVQSILDKCELIAVDGTVSKPNEIKCISTVKRCVILDYNTADIVLSFLADLAKKQDRPISAAVLAGLFELQTRMENECNIIREYGEKLSAYGLGGMETTINQYTAEIGKGGSAIAARAILSIINKGKKNKIPWK